ncbi:MAG: STM4014 family protein [Deltaproteobacteria bacterium]|nr:STM4014 family protein [Deltaproteobacteria bacterium]
MAPHVDLAVAPTYHVRVSPRVPVHPGSPDGSHPAVPVSYLGRVPRPFVIVGVPGHRRVTLFQDALAAEGCPPARVVSWRDLAVPGAPARLLGDLPDDAILRIDSAGEDRDVERALLHRGEAPARAEGSPAIDARALAAIPDELGRIVYPRQQHLGFCAILDEIQAVIAAHPRWRVTQPVAAIQELFDKRTCSRRWTALGIPMPDALPGGDVRDPDDLRARMVAAGWTTVYVKVASSSSAACLAIFQHAPGGRDTAITTVEDTGKARYNTRKLQRLVGRAGVDRLLRFLLAEGAQVERAIPKAQLERRHFDLRVLAIDGVAAFLVVRTSPHPITNLHLGGQRGDVAALQARVDPAAWDAAMATCVAVQRATGAFHVGVDLMLEPDFTTHRVIEGNAFGDLLPNLERDGTDVYGWQVRRLVR